MSERTFIAGAVVRYGSGPREIMQIYQHLDGSRVEGMTLDGEEVVAPHVVLHEASPSDFRLWRGEKP